MAPGAGPGPGAANGAAPEAERAFPDPLRLAGDGLPTPSKCCTHGGGMGGWQGNVPAPVVWWCKAAGMLRLVLCGVACAAAWLLA